MAAWDPSLGFVAFRDAIMAIYVLVHCVSATVSGRSRLSSSQGDAMLEWGQKQLTHLRQWLRDIQWTGLHKGCVARSGDAAPIVAFPHVVSHYLVKDVVEPLISLGGNPEGLKLVTEDLVSAVEQAWSLAQLAYPDVVDRDAGFLWCSGLDRIEARLAELKAMVKRRVAH